VLFPIAQPRDSPPSWWCPQISVIPRTFDIRATVRFPSTPIRVRPSIGEELKHGWIQYVAFLAVSVTVGAWA